jgi:hypothetical protein
MVWEYALFVIFVSGMCSGEAFSGAGSGQVDAGQKYTYDTGVARAVTIKCVSLLRHMFMSAYGFQSFEYIGNSSPFAMS